MDDMFVITITLIGVTYTHMFYYKHITHVLLL